MRKIVLLLFLSVSSLCVLLAQFAGGSGTELDPWQIETALHLNNIRYYLGETHNDKYFIQTADINLGVAPWNEGEGWIPLGSFTSRFQGNYNGNGFIIDSLMINRPNDWFQGLFGYTENATISNLGVTNTDIIGYRYIGGLVGFNNNSIINSCYSTGLIRAMSTGGSSIGGLVGYNLYNSYINESYSEVNVSGDYFVGGLAGLQSFSTISNSYSTGNVLGNELIGGLVGSNYYHGTIINSYSTGNITGDAVFAGGLIGQNYNSMVRNSYYNFETVLINSENVITIGALYDFQFSEWLDNNLVLDIEDFFLSDGENNLINDINDLKHLLIFGQFNEYSFLLANSLDLSNEHNFFIPYFAGVFDGSNNTIDNLSIELEMIPYIGLFGQTYNATISNFGLSNAVITGSQYIGGLVGWNGNNSVIDNCFVFGNISGERYIGGLVGTNLNSYILNSYSSSIVLGTDSIGGITGWNSSSDISNSYSKGSITGSNNIGGLVGTNSPMYILHDYDYLIAKVFDESLIINFENNYRSNSIVRNCFSMSDVNGINYVGGLVGSNIYDGSIVTKSYSTGLVSGQDFVGGLVGMNDDIFYNSIVADSYWNMETSGQESSAGGEGRTTVEMTYPYAEKTYVNWDFMNIWIADETYEQNDGYPYLRESISEEDPDPFMAYNYPNPFNIETNIVFNLPVATRTRIYIYNIKGQKILNLLDEPRNAGLNSVFWNGRDKRDRKVASGVYFYQIVTESGTICNKLLLLN
ncbi:MAG: T9SS type A sorting domain-containing protein [Candidatus Cloacimonetes bacterium]|nr:T9SS type A sorting domain-containing protein [Candidatus Cloacimonadota bacterium]